MPSVAQGGESIPNEVCLLGVMRCLSLLEDSISSEVKEEARGRPASEGLWRFVQVAISIGSSSIDLSWYWLPTKDEDLLNHGL